MAKRSAEFPHLVAYESLILHYPFTVYFFVRHDNELLAQWIQTGLEQMIADGELLEHMMQHEHTRRAFPLITAEPKRLLEIPNRYLPEFSNVNDARFWFQNDAFVESSE